LLFPSGGYELSDAGRKHRQGGANSPQQEERLVVNGYTTMLCRFHAAESGHYSNQILSEKRATL
jgi:hypothetical protein